MALTSSKIEMEKLMPGDHIYTWRSGYSYSHHGIYVGDGKVIHLTRGPGLLVFSSSTTSESPNDRVVCCNIQDFLCAGQLYRFEYGVSKICFLMKRPGTCSLVSSDPPEQVLHRSSYLVEHGFGNYNLFEKNCEDFAIYCKTGLIAKHTSGSSAQILSVASVLASVILPPYPLLPSSLIVAALVFCGTYCLWRMLLDDTNLRDRVVVAVEKLSHLSDTDNARNNMMEKIGRRWFLRFRKYVGFIICSIRIWCWTPESKLFVWFKSYVIYVFLGDFVSDHLRLHGFKLEEYSAHTIWVLGCWCLRSESTILLFTRLFVLRYFLSPFIYDNPTRVKLEKYTLTTTYLLGLWYWNPGSIYILWIRLALVYLFLFDLYKRLND